MIEIIRGLMKRYDGLTGCGTALAKLPGLLDRAVAGGGGVVARITLQKDVEAVAIELDIAASKARQLVPVVREEDAQAVRRLSVALGRTPVEPEELAPLPEPVKVPPVDEDDRMLEAQERVLASVVAEKDEGSSAMGAPSAEETTEPAFAIEGWNAARDGALAPLRNLITALGGLGDKAGREVAGIAQTVLETLDVPMTSSAQAKEIKAYLTTSKEVSLIGSANQFDIAVDLSGALAGLLK